MFGPARLDAHRISSLAIPFLSVWLSVLIVKVYWAVNSRFAADATRRKVVLPLTALCLTVALAVGVVQAGATDRSHSLCCEISDAPALLSTSAQVQRQALRGLATPILANPDLGRVSYSKTAIVEDLGELGDPVLTRIDTSDPRLATTYLGEVATPDIVELHGDWECLYEAWANSQSFYTDYRKYITTASDEIPAIESCPNGGSFTVWVRRNASLEYSLTLAIHRSSQPSDVVAAALRACSAARGKCFSLRIRSQSGSSQCGVAAVPRELFKCHGGIPKVAECHTGPSAAQWWCELGHRRLRRLCAPRD